MRKLIIKIIIISAVFIIISAILFSYRQYFSINSEINSTRIYEYGQFVSGILGIILAGFSIYLIYETFKIQTNQLLNSADQLKVEKENADLEIIDILYNQILKDISEITYIKTLSKQEFKKFDGYDSFYNWDEDKKTNPNSVLNHLVFILNSIENYISLVKKKIKIQDDLYDILLCRIYLMFHSKILWPVMEKMYNSPIVRKHTDSGVIFTKFDNLIIEAYSFLLEREMLNQPVHPRIKELLKI